MKYCVHLMYPRVEGVAFNSKWYLNVHAPMGLGLLWKHFQVKPSKMFLSAETFGVDRTPESSPYEIVATMVFDRHVEAERFIDVFEIPEAAEVLRADWPNFCGADPIAVLGSFSELKVADILERVNAIAANKALHKIS